MSKIRRVKKGGFVILAVFIIGAILGVRYFFTDSEWAITQKDTQQTALISNVILPEAPRTSSGANVPAIPPPSEAPSSVAGKTINFELMAWNAQMGFMFANGGALTTQGSLMEKHGAKVQIKRQDDVNQMAQNLIKFASDYKDDPASAEGTNFVAIMGDGAPSFLAGLNPTLEKLGKEYRAQIIFSCGKSLGEDKLMGPPSWKDNPQNARGATVATFLRDGDWNIVVKWCADNGIPVNPDEKTYDSTAMNFIAANDYIDAAQKYIADYEETRDVVVKKDGKTVRNGERKAVKVDGVATWTPADVDIAEKKGGLISIVSTAEYRSQMPNAVIGISKWMNDNRKLVESMIGAIAAGGDQVKTHGSALLKAGQISAKVYNEKDGEYWVKYYRGAVETDKQGLKVSLGGSRAHNIQDNLDLFGLAPGSNNVYASVYKVFGDILVRLYPSLVPSYPPINDVLDLTYLRNAAGSIQETERTTSDQVTFASFEGLSETVAKRDYSIEFTTGSASFTPKAKVVLDDLYDQLVVAGSLRVEVYGHTDNVGDPDANLDLSERRARAVRAWLEKKSPNDFPPSRFSKVQGLGDRTPTASNDSEAGRSKNRRVEILMGK